MILRNSKNQRPPLEKWYSSILFVFIGYCIADLGILAYRDLMLPTGAPPTTTKARRIDTTTNRGAYNPITTRNIFAANGIIPDKLVDKSKPAEEQEDIPVPSQLPLNLIGTLVHSNPEKSIAAVDIRGKNQVLSYNPGKEIENLATVVRVERQKVIIRNKNSNRLEFIEIKSDKKLAFGAGSKTPAPVATGKDVQKTGDNQYAIKRDDLLKYTKDLSSILMQARAVPNREPGTGKINGFRLLDMQPGSVYEQLGLQRMDVIKSVNGTPVDSPAKAMELYNLLKNENKISLEVESGGSTVTKEYTIQ